MLARKGILQGRQYHSRAQHGEATAVRACAARLSADIIPHGNKIFVKFSFLTGFYILCATMRAQKEGVTELIRSKKAVFQVALLICGAAMLCCGAWRGEADTVLSKAIRLCLECVGIG